MHTSPIAKKNRTDVFFNSLATAQVILRNILHFFQEEVIKSFTGDKTKLGSAEKFLTELITVERLVSELKWNLYFAITYIDEGNESETKSV